MRPTSSSPSPRRRARRRRAAEDEERLRLYYVAMTRAIDRLIVSGAVGEGRETPIRWILSRLDCEQELAEAEEPVELEREGAAFLLRVDRSSPERTVVPAVVDPDGQLALFAQLPAAPAALGYRLPELAEVPQPPLHRVRRLSYSALALYERCSYRYYAERLGGLRERRAVVDGEGGGGLAATEIGDAVHRLLELPDADLELVRGWYPAVSDEELERIGELAAAYRGSELAQRLGKARGRSCRSRSSTTACCCTGASTCSSATVRGRSSSTTRRTFSASATPAEVVESEYRLQRLVYALACFRAGADEVEVVYSFLERAEAPVATVFGRADVAELEAGAVRGDRADRRGRVRADTERVRLHGLPGARRRLRGARACEARARPSRAKRSSAFKPTAPRTGNRRVGRGFGRLFWAGSVRPASPTRAPRRRRLGHSRSTSRASRPWCAPRRPGSVRAARSRLCARLRPGGGEGRGRVASSARVGRVERRVPSRPIRLPSPSGSRQDDRPWPARTPIAPSACTEQRSPARDRASLGIS